MTKNFTELEGENRAEKLRNAGWDIVCDSKQIKRKITRIAYQIADSNDGIEKIAVVGIRTRGELLAKRLVDELERIEGIKVPMGVVEISLYRDDITAPDDQPVIVGTELPFNIDNYNLILIDDVLYTGRTIRAALNAISDYGRPKSVELAVLCDRGHRELPIKGDFVGMTLRTQRKENVRVCLEERDGEDAIFWRKS